ncbi:N-acetylmuramoyl-L-alanine amidase [Clostridium sp.]|uniref:N-acetylmuramoyl-L-alanine amidase n=1 Tax=Clostridium sp. TaxID=1506 RepID=UPI003F4BBCB9
MASAQGASILVPEPVGYAGNIYKVSQKYGEIILNNFVSTTGAKNRGISKREDLTGFNWSKVPVVLIEMGFMSNLEEDILLASDEYQNKLAKGLQNGIKEIFSQ